MNSSTRVNINIGYRHAQGRGYGSIAAAGIFVLFPLFFVYHVAIARGILPDFASGLWGVGCAALVVMAVVSTPKILRLQRLSGDHFSLFCLAFMLFTAIWIVLNGMLINESYIGDALNQMLAVWVSWVALFFLGAWFPWRRRSLVTLLSFSMIIMAFTILVYVDPSRLVFDMRHEAAVDADIASYQGFARSVVVVGTLLVCLLRRRTAILVAVAATAAMLFVVGARSEFVGFCSAMVFYAAVRLRRESLASRAYVLIGVLVAFIAGYFLFDASALMSSRQLEVLDLSEANSWVERNERLAIAVGQIIDSPLLGKFGGNYVSGIGGGGYAHNALSAWVSLGFLGFIFYIGLLLASTWITVRRYLASNVDGGIWGAAMCVSLLSLILCVVSKPVFWPVPALAWGLVFNARVSDRTSRVRDEVVRSSTRPRR